MKPNLADLLKRASDPHQYRRIPGLYRRWELEQVIDPGFEYYIEDHGEDSTGTQLYELYKREPAEDEVPR